MQHIYLSRRNLQTLLNKLDRTKAGDPSSCTLVKRDLVHPVYPCSDVTVVTAVEDSDYYIDREPGSVNPKDEPKA